MSLALGFTLPLLAPIVSNWVPFYYSSSMVIGVFLVIIIILFQVIFFCDSNVFSFDLHALSFSLGSLNFRSPLKRIVITGFCDHYPSPAVLACKFVGNVLHHCLSLIFQGMKLLPTGRKNVLYLTIYGSVVILGVLKFTVASW